MEFYFTRDTRKKFRFFSSDPVRKPDLKFTRWKKLWEMAKERLMLLPKKILSQEQAFERIKQITDGVFSVRHSGRLDSVRIKKKFKYFLQKERTKHIAFLVLETLLLPISGLMAFLPGPNVFFGFLALIMFTHWQALSGINRAGKLEMNFVPIVLLDKWEKAVEDEREDQMEKILDDFKSRHGVADVKKVLWR